MPAGRQGIRANNLYHISCSINYAFIEKKGGEILSQVEGNKKQLIDKFKLHSTDTGSSQIQIAVLSERIKSLSEHLKQHKKDHNSRRGLLKLVSRRRRLLDYLKKNSLRSYEDILDKLKLRK